MDKREIYEHLARIYLDASSKKRKRSQVYPQVFKNLFLISLLFIFALSASLFLAFQKNKPVPSEISLVLLPDAAKINFHFDPAKKEIYTFSLNRLDLSRFRALGFSVKKADFQNLISLRVEFTNAFKERSEVYFKDIPHKWQDYKITLSDFKGISDWSEILSLSFAIEEWNVKEKRGVVYIDNVRLLR